MSVATAPQQVKIASAQPALFSYDRLEAWGPEAFKYHNCTLKQDVMQLPPNTRVRSIVMDYRELVIAIWDGKHETVGELVVSVTPLSKLAQRHLADLRICCSRGEC